MRGVGAITVVAAVLFVAAPAHATHVSCGQTITTDTVLDSDLLCPDKGIVVGAGNIELDLDGHEVRGQFFGTVGIDNGAGHDGVRIEDGVVASFRTGVKLASAEANHLADLTVLGGLGVELTDSRRNTLSDLFVDSSFIEVLLTRSSENTLTGIRDTLVRIDEDSDRNVVTQSIRGKVLVTAGSDDTVVTGNHDYQVDMRASWRAAVVDNEARIVEFESMRDSVIASNVITGSAHSIAVRLATSRDNLIQDNRIDDPLPGASGGGFSRSAVLLFSQASGNRVVDNEIRGYEVGIELSGADRNVISRNVFSDNDASGVKLYVSGENTITDNVLSSNGQFGLELGLTSDSNRVEHNTIAGSGIDGVFLSATRSEQNVIADNSIGNSGDDGIDLDVANNTVTANSAFGNADWGIEAIAGTIDGGANRAWSNGQPAQCLNVVCGPGPPASLSLSPESATNTVGDEHCVTATVTDPDGRATPGVTVRFAVNGDGTAAVPTGAGGAATHCYEGPVAPREDEISAYADDDGDGSQDAGEPGATAAKSWVVPGSSERCTVLGNGSIVASNGDPAVFRVNVHVHKDRSRGSVFYADDGPADSLVVRSSRLSSITCSGGSASIFGRTHGSAPASFRIDVSDSPDTYRIRVSNGYDSGERPLTSGNIRAR